MTDGVISIDEDEGPKVWKVRRNRSGVVEARYIYERLFEYTVVTSDVEDVSKNVKE